MSLPQVLGLEFPVLHLAIRLELVLSGHVGDSRRLPDVGGVVLRLLKILLLEYPEGLLVDFGEVLEPLLLLLVPLVLLLLALLLPQE